MRTEDHVAHGVRDVRNPNAAVPNVEPAERSATDEEAQAGQRDGGERKAQEPQGEEMVHHEHGG